MSPKLMELFRSLRNEVSDGYEKGVIPIEKSENLLHIIHDIEFELRTEKSENLLHIIHDIEFELRTEKDAEAVFRETLVNRLGGMRNEIHELNRTLEKHLKRK